jgi:hypothetical protein
MEGWKVFCQGNLNSNLDVDLLKRIARGNFTQYGVYPDSIQKKGDSVFFIARNNGQKVLIVISKKEDEFAFYGDKEEIEGKAVSVCPLSYENSLIIRQLFVFTNPVPNTRMDISVGFGDRLGIASPGHIRLIEDLPVFPVLAQQSIRELHLTNRNFADVIAATAWAVFQEGYTKGYGADGDHLKSREEVKMALENGCTMITLDCSEYIRNDVQDVSIVVLKGQYGNIGPEKTELLKSAYIGHAFTLMDGTTIAFTQETLDKIVYTYFQAIQFTKEIYRDYIAPSEKEIDFEISIDETMTPTSPEAHYFVAKELTGSGVKMMSIAPRFCGEFQKGIDYKGDLVQFETEYKLHEEIAETFGYKLSIHSGSDKFSAFPIIGKFSKKYHIKTAGTSWLEAVRLITAKNPDLYRRMHKFALLHFQEATKYYHVTTNLNKVPDINKMSDGELPSLMELDDTRQLLHITYGLILQAKNEDGTSMFRSELFQTLDTYETDYYEYLQKHLGRHLKRLCIIPE